MFYQLLRSGSSPQWRRSRPLDQGSGIVGDLPHVSRSVRQRLCTRDCAASLIRTSPWAHAAFRMMHGLLSWPRSGGSQKSSHDWERRVLERRRSDPCSVLAAQRRASDCICADNGCFSAAANCTPTALCRGQWGVPHSADTVRNPAVVVPIMCHTAHECDHQRVVVRRLLVSLLATSTTLPVVLFSPNASLFEGLGAPVRIAQHFRPPVWANRYHASSFLRLQLHVASSIREFDKLIALDTDMQVVRNIDHLRDVPTPAFVVHDADKGPNGGLQVLRPQPAVYKRFLSLTYTKRRGDGGDQEVLRQLLPSFYELPLGYNLRPHYLLNQGNASVMCEAHVIHIFDRREHVKGTRPTVLMRECRRV